MGKVFWVSLVILIVGIIIFGPVRYSQPFTEWQQHYEGREVFYTESEYSEFKQAVVDYDIPLRNIEVFNSHFPIIVEIHTIVTASLDEGKQVVEAFPYGQTISEPIKTRSGHGVNNWGFILGLGMMIWGTIFLIVPPDD